MLSLLAISKDSDPGKAVVIKIFGAHMRSCLTLSVAPSKAFQAFLTVFVSVSILLLNPVPLHLFALNRKARSDSLHSLGGNFNE